MTLSFLCRELFSCRCVLCKRFSWVNLHLPSVLFGTWTQTAPHLAWCVPRGLHWRTHAFFHHGCQLVELMLWVDLKHPHHPPALSQTPPASPPGGSGGPGSFSVFHLGHRGIPIPLHAHINISKVYVPTAMCLNVLKSMGCSDVNVSQPMFWDPP